MSRGSLLGHGGCMTWWFLTLLSGCFCTALGERQEKKRSNSGSSVELSVAAKIGDAGAHSAAVHNTGELRLAAVGKNLNSYIQNFEAVVARARSGIGPTLADRSEFCPVEWMPMVADKGEYVDKGNFGVVFIGDVSCEQDKVTKVAFKVQIDSKNRQKAQDDWAKEAKMGMLFGHPYVVKFFDSSKLDNGMGVIAMEAVSGGGLKTHWGELSPSLADPVNRQELAEFTLQILWGLKYMHDMGYAHGDFKAPQVMLQCDLESACEVRIADFGLVVKATDKDPYEGMRGSPYFLAPEIVMNQNIYPASDMWALGISLHEMMNRGQLPITAPSRQKLFEKLEDIYTNGTQDADSSFYTTLIGQENTARTQLLVGLLKNNWTNRANAASAIELAKKWAQEEGVHQSRIDAIMLKGNVSGMNAHGAMQPTCWQPCKNTRCGEKTCRCSQECRHVSCSNPA